jgi:hypothetical protein
MSLAFDERPAAVGGLRGHRRILGRLLSQVNGVACGEVSVQYAAESRIGLGPLFLPVLGHRSLSVPQAGRFPNLLDSWPIGSANG